VAPAHEEGGGSVGANVIPLAFSFTPRGAQVQRYDVARMMTAIVLCFPFYARRRDAFERRMKTVRFGAVVTQAGKPQRHLTWSDPSRDPTLRTAEKRLRLLTVHQRHRGAKKDFGIVGLEPGPDAQYFVFPRSLRAFRGARIVAINYEAIGERLSMATPVVRQRTKPNPRAATVLTFPTASVPRKGPAQPKPEPARVERAPSPIPTRAEIEAVLEQTLRDLRGRRSVAAAKRLAALLAALRAPSDRSP